MSATGRDRPRRRAGLVILAVAVWLCGTGPAAADRLEEIRERGYLIAGVKADYRPFGFRDADGNLVGYDVDVARAFAEAIGVSLRLTPVTSANRLQKLQRGEIDIVVA
ncbi:MAG: transporter substrate-binding domain-containing protein, partial [Rhodospirillaceae bacterium]|nr:transporter substrate-binding domain-containing protein [Rhodospirillaceae bacterium]